MNDEINAMKEILLYLYNEGKKNDKCIKIMNLLDSSIKNYYAKQDLNIAINNYSEDSTVYLKNIINKQKDNIFILHEFMEIQKKIIEQFKIQLSESCDLIKLLAKDDENNILNKKTIN